MKRFAAWVAWIAAAAVAHATQGRVAYVDYGYSGVSPAISFRVDNTCYVSLSMLQQWGWTVERTSVDAYRVTVGTQAFTVAARHIDGDAMLPLNDLARDLDSDGRWRPHSDVFELESRVRVVRLMNGHLIISASLPVLPHVFLSPKANHVIVDLLGANLSADAIVDVAPGLVVTSPKPGSVRVELPISGPIQLDANLADPTTDLDIDTSVVKISPPPTDVGPVQETMQVDEDTDSALSLSMPLPEKLAHPPNYSRLDATTLRVWLPGVQVALSPSGSSSSSIKGVTTDPSPGGTALTFQLARPMGVLLSSENGFHIRFIKPPVGNGRLAGKVIIVDPGHGGHDSGTKALSDGLMEKSLTLAIGKLLAADLAAQGATVIMTRQTDVFIPLTERAAIANRNHASLFLCVHINSNGRDTRSSGSITFYHSADPVSSTLADCIERQLAAVGGVPGIGIWSDTRIYQSGFSVLRNIRMPGVLMELGFINNAHDRPILTNATAQKAMAAAIVEGVKVYLGQPSDHEK